MGRDILELAGKCLFIVKIKHTFKAADTDLLKQAYVFFLIKTSERDPIGYKAADLLLEQGADAITVAGALVAPLLWQDLANLNDIRDNLGPAVAAALEDLSSQFITHDDNGACLWKDVHPLLAAIGSVPRKALLFITLRLLALEYTPNPCENSARRMAQETLDFLVPIANRLSLGDLRRRLEEACFYILDPANYAVLREKVTPIQAEDDKCLQILLAGVRRLLNNNDIQGRVQGRTKSLHGIRRKMMLTGKILEEIMDRVGLRVIVTSVPECYTVLGLLHAHFKPIPGTFNDYIGLPKDNGYQSLHTCVYPVREISHKPIEFQVRTELMYTEAEHGTAAHWRYKSEVEVTKHDHQRAQWMEGLVRQHQESGSSEAFFDLLHRKVFRNHLVVFGNGGRIVRLSDKVKVHDCLNIINVNVPEASVVKVNGKVVDMDRPLRDGDSIEFYVNDDLYGNQSRTERMKSARHGTSRPYLIEKQVGLGFFRD